MDSGHVMTMTPLYPILNEKRIQNVKNSEEDSYTPIATVLITRKIGQ